MTSEPTRFTLDLLAAEGPSASDRAAADDALAHLADELALDPSDVGRLAAAHLPLCRWIDAEREALHQPIVVGVSGSQGSGKTTFCRFAQVLLERQFNRRVCGLSIDDLYLGAAERRRLAERVHPLLATRGVPGTHDVPLGVDLLRRLSGKHPTNGATEVHLPVFDKAIDDRAPEPTGRTCHAPVDVVIFEGWCVAAQPQGSEALESPINALEAQEDPDGRWRRFVNDALRGPYAELFAEIDLLIFLQVPDWQSVRRWRRLQEEKLARRRPGASALMDKQELDRFMMCYERITRHNLETLPHRADVVCRIDSSHRITHLSSKEPWPPTLQHGKPTESLQD